MTEPTRKPRAKTRVKNLGAVKASLVAVSMALTVGGWAVMAREDSLVLSQTMPQAGIEQSAPAPTPTAPPPPTTAPVPFQPNRRDERSGQSSGSERREGSEQRTPRTLPNQVPTQLAPQPTQPAPTQPTPTQPAPLPTQPPAPIPPTVAPQQRTQPSAPSTAPRVSPPVQAPQPRARTRSSK